MQTITKEMTIGEVLQLDRESAKVFMQHGMHCLGCPHATAEAIDSACQVHGTDADKLVSDLNEHFAMQ